MNFHRRPTTVSSVKWARILIDGHLTVRAENIHPGNESYGLGGTAYFEFEIDRIIQETARMQRNSVKEIEMRALLPLTELKHRNTHRQVEEKWSDGNPGTEVFRREALSGVIGRYGYSFRQNGQDVQVSVRLAKGESSRSASDDTKFYHALLMAFNWMNGGTPFDRHLAHRRDFATRHVASNHWDGPITKPRIISGDYNGNLATEFLAVTVPFLLAKTPFVSGVKQLLWQYRETIHSDSITWGAILQICTLLEGLMGLILRYPMRLNHKSIRRLPPPLVGVGMPGSAEARFYAAGSHLGFSWPQELEPVFRRWKNVRNQLAHGELTKILSNSSSDPIGDYNAVVQAFNSLLLRAMGYRKPLKMDGGWFAIDSH